MRNIHRISVVLIAAAVLGHGQIAAQGGWQTVANGPGRFSITVPAPLSEDRPVTDPNGVVSHTFVASVGGKAYVVAYADGAIPNWRAEMDAARDALLKGLTATLVSEHRFKSAQPVGDVEATEFTCASQSAGTECKARSFWHKSRLYMIGVLYRAGTGSSLETDKFLDSFRITS
jgi:hypothetical protein